ncbi:MAG: hydroxymethylglutaryl-CoA lyase [Oceanococcus sp.]
MSERVVINDVGPRDGLQNQAKILTPAQRLQLIQALLDAGIRHIEIGAFVSPKAVPAMAGTEEIAAALPKVDAEFSALIPNRKGYERARDAGIRTMGLVVAASNTMNERNIRMTTDAALDVARDVLSQAKSDGMRVQVCIATAWECPFEGAVAQDTVSTIAEQLMTAGASELLIADTIGAANPMTVRSLMDRLVAQVGADQLICHFHDTRALGMANAYAALEAGIRRFDASIGGLGGCPFAPGATGNIATEDLAMMLSLMGFETGLDIDKLLAAGQLAGELTETCTGGRAYKWLSNNTTRFKS